LLGKALKLKSSGETQGFVTPSALAKVLNLDFFRCHLGQAAVEQLASAIPPGLLHLQLGCLGLSDLSERRPLQETGGWKSSDRSKVVKMLIHRYNQISTGC